MRIVVLANPMSPHTHRWSRAYAEEGHEVHVVGIRHADIPGVEVHRVGIRGRTVVHALLSYMWLLLSVRRVVGRIGADVVHAHYSVTNGTIAVLARLHPVVLTVWGTDLVAGERPVGGPKRWLNRFVLRRVQAVTGASGFLVDAVRRVAGDVPVHHIPFGVDTEMFRPAPAAPEAFTVGWVKSLRSRYDPTMALRAFGVTAAKVPGARLIMAGAGPERARLERTAGDLGLRDRVEFIGAVAHDTLPELMHGFSVLLNTSRSESFGVVLLEAAACGLPVVATRVGGVSEVVDDGVTGILVPVGDADATAAALVRLDRSLDEARSLGEAGRARVVDLYRWSECVAAMLRVLEEARR